MDISVCLIWLISFTVCRQREVATRLRKSIFRIVYPALCMSILMHEDTSSGSRVPRYTVLRTLRIKSLELLCEDAKIDKTVLWNGTKYKSRNEYWPRQDVRPKEERIKCDLLIQITYTPMKGWIDSFSRFSSKTCKARRLTEMSKVEREKESATLMR